METSDSKFKEDVLESGVPVLVDFWATWCRPCGLVGTIMDKIEKKAAGKVKVIKVNVDENPELSSRYEILSVPTVMVFKSGQMEKSCVGMQPESVYLELLDI